MDLEKKDDKNFETLFKEIDEIVQKLESGEIGLEESIKLYEKGSGLIKQSEKKLVDSKMTLEKIIAKKSES